MRGILARRGLENRLLNKSLDLDPILSVQTDSESKICFNVLMANFFPIAKQFSLLSGFSLVFQFLRSNLQNICKNLQPLQRSESFHWIGSCHSIIVLTFAGLTFTLLPVLMMGPRYFISFRSNSRLSKSRWRPPY